jgi:hypothetical protein
MKSFRVSLSLLSAMAALVVALPANASTVFSALTFTGSGPNGTATTSTRGYAFDVTADGLSAVALSIWDDLGNGLTDSHDVGLWDPSGNLIASATIPSGTAATLVDGFREVAITPVALPIGSGYTVGALFIVGTADVQAITLTGISTAPGITYVGGRFINNGVASLTLPTSSFNGLIGGSLLVDTGGSSVPEPSSLSLLVLGAGMLAFKRIRR